MNASPSPTKIIRLAWQDFLRNWRALAVFEIGFKLFEAWLLAPAGALLFSAAMFASGRVALANREVLNFLLSPMGIFYAVLMAIATAALVLVEQACIMGIASPQDTGQPLSLRTIFLAAVVAAQRIVRLGALQAGLLALAAVPFLAAAGLTYWLLLTEYDIYFYWKTRPTSFWLAVGIGAALLSAAGLLAIALFVRWAFALPILLFERLPASAALRESAARVRGHAWRIGGILVGWQLAVLVVSLISMAGFRWIAAWLLAYYGHNSNLAVVALLFVHAGLILAGTFIGAVGQGLLTRRLYLAYGTDFATDATTTTNEVESTTPLSTAKPSAWRTWGARLGLAAVVIAPLGIWYDISHDLLEPPRVEITAHRGHARRAPENTLSALRKAIESGADYAEIDVQLTSDGVVVLLHDSDLKRVAGVSRRLADLTYAELQQIDVGRWFGPQFTDERAPTLVEAMDLVRGKMKLNIELKFYGPSPQLAPTVAKLVEEHRFVDECVATSFEYDALMQAKQVCPRLRIGLIVAQSLGNINRLQVDLLSVRADHLTDGMLQTTHALGREVHVWTVNDPRQMLQMMRRGVDNLMTSDPDKAIAVRQQWTEMPPAERFLSAARLLLGLQP